MSLKKIKEEYTKLLVSGDLLEMFPQLTGRWQDDKEYFEEMYCLNNNILGEN